MNDIENYDYIVKCKEINAEVADTLKRRFDTKNIRNLTIYIVILYVFFIIKIYESINQIFWPTFFFGIVLIVIFYIMSLEKKWSLKIKERKIYVKYDLRNYVIEYSDLLNFELTKLHKRIKYGHVIDALVITFMKNGKIKKIILEARDYLKPELNEICKAFVKKSQLDSNSKLYNDYFDITGEDIEIKLNALKRYNNRRLVIACVWLILILIPFVLIIIQLTK